MDRYTALLTADALETPPHSAHKAVDVYKRQILDSGENISPEELEGIVGKCEAVKECVVKEMGKKIGVVVYCDDDKQQQVRDFITEANRTLPLYKRMSAVECSTEPLPRNGAGKLLRQ